MEAVDAKEQPRGPGSSTPVPAHLYRIMGYRHRSTIAQWTCSRCTFVQRCNRSRVLAFTVPFRSCAFFWAGIQCFV